MKNIEISNIENIHIFDDGHGHYSNLSYYKFKEVQPNKNLVLNLSMPTKIENQNIFQVDFQEILELLAKNNHIQRIFFHYMSFRQTQLLELVRKAHTDLILIWVFWGGDFYHLKENYRALHTEESLPFIPKVQWGNKTLTVLKNIIKPMLGIDNYSLSKIYSRYRYLDYLCVTFKGDFDNVKKISGHSTLQYLPYSYIALEDILEELPTDYLSCSLGTTIMVGHSAKPLNNQLEILNKLASWKHIRNTIFLPLAYGNEMYIDKIERIANGKFGHDRVVIQKEFMPLKEYYEQLLSVGYVVINTKSQAGFGNIVVLLLLGAKVFLREETAIYKAFKGNGCLIYSVQSDLKEENIILHTLEEIEHNRAIVREMFAKETVNSEILRALTVQH